jgi:DNA repair exonuclease SbcCD nuclease subunit
LFRFIHAADIHLDSPLRGLERYEGAPVDEIRRATRRAFDNLVQLAIDEQVAFVLLAGDSYDGDWKDYQTGLYFVRKMAQLRDAEIRVFAIAGNHDAANRMTKELNLPDNVHWFAKSRPKTVSLDDCGGQSVAIHGQSFATAAVTEDLSAAYPAAVSGHFNIGLLHTSATGREGHENYAPCTVEGLVAKRYDYWALGHIHKHEILHRDPWIIFPGNIQGRHIRETGPKGCMLVTVGDDGRVDPRSVAGIAALDVLRWEHCELDATDAATPAELMERLGRQIERLVGQAEDRPLAIRVTFRGECAAHDLVTADPERWINEVRATGSTVGSGNVWIEQVRFRTAPPRQLDDIESLDGPIAELTQLIKELQWSDDGLARLAGELADLKKKLPVELRTFPDAIDLDDPDTLRGTLDDVRQLLVGRLTAREVVA